MPGQPPAAANPTRERRVPDHGDGGVREEGVLGELLLEVEAVVLHAGEQGRQLVDDVEPGALRQSEGPLPSIG